MIGIYELSVIVFLLILGILIYRDRKNVEFKYILIIKKTKKGKKFLDKIAKSSPKFWKTLSTLAILFCFYIMFSSLFNLIMSLKLVIEKKIAIPIVQFVVPLPKPEPISGPGYLAIPFWFWMVLIPFVLIPHEISHGIIARTEKIRIKSVGLFLLTLQLLAIPIVIFYFVYTKSFNLTLILVAILLAIPGAFVEPDEKQLEKSKLIKKLRVFSAGSAANFVLVFILLIISRNFIWPFFVSPGLVLKEVNETAPAGKIGLKPGMIIQEIDGKEANFSFDDFGLAYSYLLLFHGNVTEENVHRLITGLFITEVLENYEPNDTMSLKVDNKIYELKLAPHPQNSSLPYIGISTKINSKTEVFSTVLPLLWLCIFLGWAVAAFNILPIYPFDGGLIIDGIAKRISEKHRKKIVFVFTFFTISLLAFGFTLPLLK